MSRSTAIRCLLLLGPKSVERRAIDPKTKATFEGPTLPLLRFFKRGTTQKWFSEGTVILAIDPSPCIDVANKLHRQPQRYQRVLPCCRSASFLSSFPHDFLYYIKCQWGNAVSRPVKALAFSYQPGIAGGFGSALGGNGPVNDGPAGQHCRRQ